MRCIDCGEPIVPYGRRPYARRVSEDGLAAICHPCFIEVRMLMHGTSAATEAALDREKFVPRPLVKCD